MATPTTPKTSNLWKIALLVAGGLTTFGVAGAALLSNPPTQPTNQVPQNILQTPATSTSIIIDASTSTGAIDQSVKPLVTESQPTETQAEGSAAAKAPQAAQPVPVKTQQPLAVPDAPNGTYKNTAGNVVPSPYVAPSKPAGASAKCRDGSFSFSQSRSGTCSHHGGVAEWY
ncbi:MAG: DUF3761 domain-containing protein [Patescibacteria group bacterium]